MMTGFVAWDIRVTVAFPTTILKVGTGTRAEARAKQCLFTICENMTHACHQDRFYLYGHPSW